MGKAHVVAYSNMPKLFWPAPFYPVFKTVCDIVPEIAEDAKERFGFEKCCTDYMDIINDPEIGHRQHLHAQQHPCRGCHRRSERRQARTLREADLRYYGAGQGHGGKRLPKQRKKALFPCALISTAAYLLSTRPRKIIESGAIGELTNVRNPVSAELVRRSLFSAVLEI